MLVSTVLVALDPRGHAPFERDVPDATPSVSDLVATMLDVDEPETSAVLAVIAGLSDDEFLRSRIRRELARRRHALPGWLDGLSDVRPYRSVEATHVLADGENVVLGARLSSGQELTVLCYVDFNLGTVVKDAFVVDEPVGAVLARMRAALDDPDAALRDIDPAEARARIAWAIKIGAMTFPPLQTETWPACRPLVEWLVRSLPEGGTGYEHKEWSDTELDVIAAGFLASSFGSAFAGDEDQRYLLDSLLWYSSAYGPCDPLRWSPTSVEIVLLDWIPRKLVADTAILAAAPALLRGLIRYCHRERGVRASLTADTLSAVDAYEPEYQQLIRSPRPQGPMALLAAMGALDPDTAWENPDDTAKSLSEIMLEALRATVGGEEALHTVQTTPLPDEDFDWADIPSDIHAPVADVLALCDRCCAQLLDVEYRTAARRLLARAARGDPAVFRRRARADNTAAAVCWIVGKANHLFDSGAGGMQVKDLLAHFGVSGSVSQRATTLLRAGGFPTDHYGEIRLGSPDYLVSARRRSILTQRDRHTAG